MIQTSEWVSPGHPDKVADAISSAILDYCLSKDPTTRYAVECQIKDNFVTLGGEVSSRASLEYYNLLLTTASALRRIGYTHDYAVRWGADNAIDPDGLFVQHHIGVQSPDIAQGVDQQGWGDQGIFWGMATRERDFGYLPRDFYLARDIGQTLYGLARRKVLDAGLDIKTQIEITDGTPTHVIVAIPTRTDERTVEVRCIVQTLLAKMGVKLGLDSIVVNGTGRYVRHASQGDCGTTGRKLAVDFYGGNCRIGGGSPWTKDPSKADLTLNLYARKLALEYVLDESHSANLVYVAISCCIGQRAIRVTFFDEENNQLETRIEERPPREIVEELGLRNPIYGDLCERGLFSGVDRDVAGIQPFDPAHPFNENPPRIA